MLWLSEFCLIGSQEESVVCVKCLEKGVVFPWNAHIWVFIYWYFCVICELHIQVNLDHITQPIENWPFTLCSWLDMFQRKFGACIIRVSSVLKFLWNISRYLAVYTSHPRKWLPSPAYIFYGWKVEFFETLRTVLKCRPFNRWRSIWRAPVNGNIEQRIWKKLAQIRIQKNEESWS